MKDERIRRRRQISSTPNTDKLEELVESGALDMPYKCTRCGLPAQSIEQLRTHLQMRHRPEPAHQHSYIPIEKRYEHYETVAGRGRWYQGTMQAAERERVVRLYCTTCEETKEL